MKERIIIQPLPQEEPEILRALLDLGLNEIQTNCLIFTLKHAVDAPFTSNELLLKSNLLQGVSLDELEEDDPRFGLPESEKFSPLDVAEEGRDVSVISTLVDLGVIIKAEDVEGGAIKFQVVKKEQKYEKE